MTIFNLQIMKTFWVHSNALDHLSVYQHLNDFGSSTLLYLAGDHHELEHFLALVSTFLTSLTYINPIRLRQKSQITIHFVPNS